MKYIQVFNSLKDLNSFKKHILAEADSEMHCYTLIYNEDIMSFSASNEADEIVIDDPEENTNEYYILKGIQNCKLLGNDYDYENNVVLTKSELSKMTTLKNAFSGSISGKILTSNEELLVSDLSMLENCDNITNIAGYDGKEYGNMFAMTNLEKVVIPKNVTEIGVSAFAFCLNLSDITMHDNIKTICQKAFYSCLSLSTIAIPVSVKTIEANAFAKCNNLTRINIASDTPCKIYKDSFTGVNEKCKIYVPKGTKSAYVSQWKYVKDLIVESK